MTVDDASRASSRTVTAAAGMLAANTAISPTITAQNRRIHSDNTTGIPQAPIYPGQRNDDPTDTYAGSWTYGYDHLNRIANAAGPGGSTAYTIDAFSNKTVQTTKSGSAPSPNYSAALSNGLTGNGVTDDLANYAGNVTYDGFHSSMYDAEGRLYEVVDQTICYTYDGDGDRVATNELQCRECWGRQYRWRQCRVFVRHGVHRL